MTLTALANGLLWPVPTHEHVQQTFTTTGTMDAATEKITFNGYLYVAGRNTSSHTLSAAGGGSISFRTGTTTFAAAAGGTTLDIGLQDFSTSGGPAGQPDGTFDVKRTLVSATDTVTTAAWNTVSMTGGSGTKTLTHGDLISVVFDMTARTAPDSVILQSPAGTNFTISNSRAGMPNANTFTSAAWAATGSNVAPNVLITFDDGTLAVLSGTAPWSTYTLETFNDASSPDERGLLFQVPWDCKIDALWVVTGGLVNANGTLALWSAPTTAPSSVTSFTITGAMLGGNTDMLCIFQLPTEISLTKNTDYAVALKATHATSSLRFPAPALGNTAYRAFMCGGTSLARVTRTGGSGNFAAESPAVTMHHIGVRISQLHDTASGGGSGVIGG